MDEYENSVKLDGSESLTWSCVANTGSSVLLSDGPLPIGNGRLRFMEDRVEAAPKSPKCCEGARVGSRGCAKATCG